MKLSYTGSQHGMTERQMGLVIIRLEILKPSAVIHGGCIGGDDQFDQICAQYGIPRFIYGSNRPDKSVPDNVLKSRTGSQVVIISREEPLLRNSKIVRASNRLMACPHQPQMIIRSGTWTTIRHGWKILGRENVEIILP